MTFLREPRIRPVRKVWNDKAASGRMPGIATAANDQTAILVGAGNFVDCKDLTGAEATAESLDKIPGTVMAVGDLAYPDGSKGNFTSYDKTRGRAKSRTRPAPGNHDFMLTERLTMKSRHPMRISLAAVLSLVSSLMVLSAISAAAQDAERVTPIAAPATPLPPEAQSVGVTQFSFLAYGDTRGRRDGISLQYDHSVIVDLMLQQIKKLHNTPYPVRFALQSGDAVQRGQDAHQWNVSFVPLINRLTTEGGIPYFLAPGNHDVSSALTVEDPKRLPALRNYLDAVSALIPPDGSPRRLSGYPTYSFGYGNTFVIGLDADIAGDEKQFQWVKGQLGGLDRTRYVNVFVFCHQAPFSSGPHGGAKVEQPTVELRTRYMPLFHTHHVRAVFSGHEHLFEHWVEHYTDAAGTHRMDLVVSGGGGAPIYPYTGEPDLDGYLKANDLLKVSLQHLVKPGNEDSPTPYHYLIVKVDGDKLEMQVIGVEWGRNFAPYRSNEVELRDPSMH